MKRIISSTILLTIGLVRAPLAQDANNPIDPSPTLGFFNRFYGDDFSRSQFIGNVTFERWFVRVSAEEQFNYGSDEESREFLFKGANLLVARLYKSQNDQHKFGFGAIGSYFNPRGWGGGVNFVSVSKFNQWKVISLTTLQGGDEIFAMEFQPGLYRDLNKGWYIRSHPRMLFDFEREEYEIPIGFGFGNVLETKGAKVNLLLEPQYDFSNDRWILYSGVKILWK